MLYNLLSGGIALWVILDELLDKTTVQGRSAAQGRSAGYSSSSSVLVTLYLCCAMESFQLKNAIGLLS
jgi:hypothetical protein